MCIVLQRLMNNIASIRNVNFIKHNLNICSSSVSTKHCKNMADSSDANFQAKLLQLSKQLAPSLTLPNNYKGQAGKIGIIGGSVEYTGAPYFAAISALKVGADLVHVFCSKGAAIPIKCYSPELIVHPLLDPTKYDDIRDWLERLDVILIGPGLGRDKEIFSLIEKIINYLKDVAKPLIIDADGLYLITQKPELLNGFQSQVILTPNKMELSRLLGLKNPSFLSNADPSKFMKDQFWQQNITILSKGFEDEVLTGDKKLSFANLGGSGRRCGGQGDILAGALSVFLHWSQNVTENKNFVASYAACKLVRECSKNAFLIKGRSMMATDMIEEIHTVFGKHFEVV